MAGDEGVALIFVIGIIMVMSTLLATSIAYAVATKPVARHSQDWNAALAAAQAGVDDYVAKLNQSDSYAQTLDCSNVALRGPKTVATCGFDAPGWVDVETGNAKAGQFHYDVDVSDFWKSGAVRLNSTGRVGKAKRTVQVRVSRGGSTEFLYYTDFEDADPDNRVSYNPGGTFSAAGGGPARTECGKDGPTSAKYWYQGRAGLCSEISFAGFDVLDGKVHFNDTANMSNSGGTRPRFLQGFETADPNCTVDLGKGDASGVGLNAGKGKCWRSTSAVNPYVGTSGAIHAEPLYLPDNSDKFVTFPGCQYTGDTRIRFLSSGKMEVWNTGSVGTSVKGPDTPGAANSCGDASNFKPKSGTEKYPAAKQTVDVPNDMVIYVKNSSSGTSTCSPGQVVNATSSGSTAGDQIPQGTGATSTGVNDISYFDPDKVVTTSAKTWTRSRSGSTWTWVPGTTTGPTPSITSDDHPKTFDCGLGNVYVEGTVKGRVTIAAQNNVIITGDMSVAGASGGTVPAGPDIVGLVAANSVVVYHPVSRDSSTDSTSSKSPSGVSGSCPSSVTGTPGGGTTGSSGSNYTMTCTWTDTKTYATSSGSYDSLSYPNATGSSGNRYVFASIQTLQHSFWVQSYNRGGELGKLSVRGSIAQKWRGAVGTLGSPGTGYQKDYSYDARLKFSSPPYFPQWANAVWAALTTGELKPQY
jgi:hypothetical protein